jgi:DNA-binding NtrC family response regulator
LDDEAKTLLINYPWPGNVRELKNIAEQMSVLSTDTVVTADELRKFLPEKNFYRLPVLAEKPHVSGDFANEREILYKLFFDMRKDVTELKKMFLEILQNPALSGSAVNYAKESLNDYNVNGEHKQITPPAGYMQPATTAVQPMILPHNDEIQHHEEIEESLNIMDKEKELIVKALKKHRGKRKDAAADLGISERTLYRKLKEYDINE